MNHPQSHDLTALAYGLVSGPEREQMLGHLAECDTCREVYDTAFDEQATVREAMFADVRSGEAEARALERALNALASASLDEDRQGVSRPVGRLFSLPRPARYALEAAAMIVLALGVFALVQAATGTPNSGPGTGNGDSLANIKDNNTKPDTGYAAVKYSKGEWFAQEDEGAKWQRTERLPLNTWVKAGDREAISLGLENGATFNLSANTVFKLEPVKDKQSQYKVYLRSGELKLQCVEIPTTIQTEHGKVLAEAGSAVDVRLFYDNAVLDKLDVKAVRGQTLICGDQKTMGLAVLQDGERIVVSPTAVQFCWMDKGHPTVLDLKLLHDDRESDMRWITEQGERMRKLLETKYVLEAVRPEEIAQLRVAVSSLGELKTMIDRGLVQQVMTTGDNTVCITQGGNSLTVQLTSRDGRSLLVATLNRPNLPPLIKSAASLEELQELMPEAGMMLFDMLTLEETKQGLKLRIVGELDIPGENDEAWSEGSEKKYESILPTKPQQTTEGVHREKR